MKQRDLDVIDKHVFPRLRSARLLAKKSQMEAAKAMGITFQQIRKYEVGENRVSLGRAVALCQFYGVPLDYLLSGAPGLKDSPSDFEDPGAALTAKPGGAELARKLVSLPSSTRAAIAAVVECL